MEGGLDRIDWEAPWLSPWRATGERVTQRVLRQEPLHEALNAQPGAPLRFVPQDRSLSGAAYEHSIHQGDCPVRANLHDFFSGICWLQFPKSKLRLNELHSAQITVHGEASPRGPVRDALTVLDENGALLDAPQAIWAALLTRQWQRLFIDLRPLWQDVRLLIFGHALLEKMVTPRKGLTAHVWRAPCPLDSLTAADIWLARQLDNEFLATKPFIPLPVLGVPGWWAPNADPLFYDDANVFRSGRRTAAA